MTLIVANLLALKIWRFFDIPVDAGILLFPLSYITGDLLAEFYGEKIADFVAFVAASFGVMTLTVFYLASCLPNYPGADNSGFEAAASLAGRIFLASIVSFLLGQIANNRLFEKVRHRRNHTIDSVEMKPKRITDKRFLAAFAERAIVSSGVAHAVDAVVFEVIAFYGKLPISEFLRQVIWAYIFGLAIELFIFPLTYFLAYKGHSAS